MCRAGGPYCYDRRDIRRGYRDKVEKRNEKRKDSTYKEQLETKLEKKPIIVALDLDNTTFDFNDGFRRFLAKKNGLTREESLERYPDPTNYNFSKGDAPWFSSTGEFLTNFKEAEKAGLYRDMPAEAGAIRVISKMLKREDIEVHFVTARGDEYTDDTLAALKKHNLDGQRLVHESEKTGYPAHIYIDDKDDFVEEIQKGEHTHPDGKKKHVIALQQEYNKHLDTVPDWDSIYTRLNEIVRSYNE